MYYYALFKRWLFPSLLVSCYSRENSALYT